MKVFCFIADLAKVLRLATAVTTLAIVAPALAEDAAKSSLSPVAQLGKALFEDPSLSQPAGNSCSSCHEKAKSFTGNNHSSIPTVALGSRPGQFGTRKVPSLMYMAYSTPLHFSGEPDEKGVIKQTAKGGQFWDGRANSFNEQAMGPLFNPLEMNNSDEKSLIESVKNSGSAMQMRKVFGDAVFDDSATAMKNVTAALAAYENSDVFRPFDSKFDRFLQGKAQLTKQEQLGFALFKDKKKGNCISCHAGKVDSKDPTDWLFTDFTYDNLGLPRNTTIPANAAASNFDLGLCKRPGIEKLLPPDVKLDDLCGAFKVPSLRDVALRSSFYHNGAFTALHDAVEFYATRDTNPAKWYPKNAEGQTQKKNDLPAEYRQNVNTSEVPYDRKAGQQPRLSASDVNAIVAFLKTLTDSSLAAK